MPDNSAAHKQVVLTALAGVDVELGHSGVKIAQLSAQAQGLQYLYIQPHAHLEHSRVGAGITGIGSAEFQLGFFAEVAKTTTKAMLTTRRMKRVLVVDDQSDCSEPMARLLKLCGFDAQTAANGRDALDKLHQWAADLVLLDLMMPIMDGRTFRERQLASPSLAAIPVIVFSAYRDVAAAATEMKAVGHLEKPVRLPDLLRQVRQYCPNMGDHSRLS